MNYIGNYEHQRHCFSSLIMCSLICCFISVFGVLINEVSLQETVEGFIRSSVVLPCSSTERDHKLQDVDVNWRHNGSENVYDIVKGDDSVERQHPLYKNRVETFPEEYLRGNFSIKINNLQYTDAGEFSCLISHSSEQKTVKLSIKESTAKKESKSSEQENQEDTEADSVDTSNWVFILLAVLLLFILSIACFIICYCRKKNQAPSFSPVMTEDKEQ
ncbi:myelin-oligodendrocyte glycoprotein-like [Ctenopharyngodon idella]|uniref:myelin-oligodendrocyte glycoprotein-like n=1 Tax=Ctenopharyngodon idella TaxID=7959 RepID=UPI00222E316A|nr:myelin-oligodendrocyte glycoprotein-like [Ctenopharyngodon idella]